MDLTQLDLGSITWERFFVITLVVSIVDFAVSVIAAIYPPNVFSWSLAARVLESHILKRVIPITALAFIALSFPAGGAHDLVWGAAIGGLALYVGETVKSLMDSVGIAKLMAGGDTVTDEPIPDEPEPELELDPLDPDVPVDGAFVVIPEDPKV